jgi:hypothetical protein
MKKTIRLRYLLPQLVVATTLFSTLDTYSLAQTTQQPLPTRSEPIHLAQTSAEDFSGKVNLYSTKSATRRHSLPMTRQFN